MNALLHPLRCLSFILLGAISVCMLSSCEAAGLRPDAAFVKASRLIHDSIAVDYVSYVQQDQVLSQEQKANRVNAIGDWEFMLRQAEKAILGGGFATSVVESRGPPEPPSGEAGGGSE